MQIVGIVGRAGSGKDHMAKLLQRHFDFWPIALADQLKVELIMRGEMTVEEAYDTKPPRVRSRLQTYGTEDMRAVYGEDVWVRAVDAWISVVNRRTGRTRFVIPDVRFLNEASWVRGRLGFLIKLIGQEHPLSAGQRLHRSEVELGEIAADLTVVNCPETYAAAEEAVLRVVAEWLGEETGRAMPQLEL